MAYSREEHAPLLGNSTNTAYLAAPSIDIDGESIDHVTILTSRTPSILSRSNSYHSERSVRNSSSSSSSSSHNPGDNPSSKHTNVEHDDLVASRLAGASLITILAGMYTGVFLGSLDSSIVATIYTQIGTEFKRSNEIVWIATSYMLSFTALQPLYGRISDAFGRKSAFLFATTLFFVGSLLCGAAPNMWTLVFARLVAGMGGGGINTMTTIISSDLIPLRERGKYQGYGNIAFGMGSMIGAPLGGFITETIGWRYCFYINGPFLIITVYVATCMLTNYNLAEKEDSTLIQRLKEIDYLGAVTIVSAVVCFLVATSMGGNLRPWSDPLVVGCLIASLVLSLVFGFVEIKVAKNPLMPWDIVTSQTPLACSLANFFAVMSSTAINFIVPLYFQGLLGFTPSHAGLYYLPKIIFGSAGSVFAGFYMAKTGEYRKATILGSLASLAAMIGYSFWSTQTPFYLMIPSLVLDGFSIGLLLTTTLTAMLTCVGAKEMATITSMSYLFRSAGGVIGISATSAIFQGVVKKTLLERITGPDAAKYIEIARTSMNDVRNLLPADILDIVLATYELAIRYAFTATVVIAVLCILSTLYIQQFELHTKIRRS